MKRLPPAPTPRTLRRRLEVIAKIGSTIDAEFAWLYPSAFEAPRTETHERTRRSVGCVTGTLAAVVVNTDAVRHHLADAADKVDQSLALFRGAIRALKRAQAALESATDHQVATDPLPPAAADKDELARLRDAQSRRNHRAAGGGVPWSSQEAFG